MIKRYQQLAKLINEQIKNYGASHNVKGIVESATEKARNKFSNVQNVTTEKYNIFAEKLNKQITIVGDQELVPLPKRIVKWWHWYSKLTGLDIVEVNKKQVNSIECKLFEFKEKRRISNKNLANATEKLNDVMVELAQIERDNPKYMHLRNMEYQHARDQKKIFNDLTLLEKEEQDIFTQLATFNKEYQDSQTLNNQKAKKLFVLVSIMLGLISLITTMVYNYKKIFEIKNSLLDVKSGILDVRHDMMKAQERHELLFQQQTKQLTDLTRTVRSFDNKLSQSQNINKDKGNGISNILMTSAKYSASLLISGTSYVYKGIRVCGSFVAKPFQ